MDTYVCMIYMCVYFSRVGRGLTVSQFSGAWAVKDRTAFHIGKLLNHKRTCYMNYTVI